MTPLLSRKEDYEVRHTVRKLINDALFLYIVNMHIVYVCFTLKTLKHVYS